MTPRRRPSAVWAAAVAAALLAACQRAATPTPTPAPPATVVPPHSEPTPAPTLATAVKPLAALPLLFPVQSPEVAAYFNRIARPDDLAMFPSKYASLMSDVVVGRRVVLFTSWADAERQIDRMRDQVDIVVYDPEHWSETPPDEQQALPSTVQRASRFAHDRGLSLLVAPDRAYAQAYLGQMAPDADLLILQGQRLQNDPGALASFTRSMVGTARARNPRVKIFLQIAATQPVPPGLLGVVDTLSQSLDGLAIWSLPRTLDTLQSLVGQIRS